MATDPAALQARELLLQLEEIDLDRFKIVGNYLRFDEGARSSLKDFRQRVFETYQRQSVDPCNFLLWGAPGSGKTYLVQQIAALLGDGVQYLEINLARQDEASFREALRKVEDAEAPVLCLVDEVDAKPTEPWPYELLLPLLEPPRPRTHPGAFVLAGSGGQDLSEMQSRIRGRPKGLDLLSRIPRGNEFVVPSLAAGDRVVVSVVQLLLAAWAEGHPIREVEKLALYYVAVEPTFTSARQLRSLASQAAQRIPRGEDRIRYDNLFGPGSPENKTFWEAAATVRDGLAGTFAVVDAAGIDAPVLRPSVSPLTVRAKSAALPSATRIAVLPFANMSPDPNDEYFADGLTEELITRLYEVKGLEVIARTSVMSYKKRESNIVLIGKELTAGTLIEGSVRKAGNRIRVTAQLIHGETGVHLWASTYDRNLDDIFAIQTELAVKIAQSTGVALQAAPATSPPPDTADLDAYSDFLRGNQLVRGESPESWKEAGRLFERAITKDPVFARAFVGVGWATWLSANYGLTPYAEGVLAAKRAVGRALKLNDGLAEAHALLARILWADDDARAADRAARRALELNPNLPEAYSTLDQIAAIRGDPEESLRLAERAYRLDPLGASTVGGLGVALLYAGKEKEVLEFWGRNRHLNQYRAAVGLVELYLGSRDFPHAEEALAEAQHLRPNSPWTRMLEAYLVAAKGDSAGGRKLLGEFEAAFPDWPGPAGFILCALHDLDGCFERVNRALAAHSLHTDTFMYSPLCAEARSDPRYAALMRQMHALWFPDDGPTEASGAR